MRLSRTGVLLFGAIQAALAVRVVRRMLAPSGPPLRCDSALADASLERSREGVVSVVVPVLNEVRRLGPCLDGLIAQDATVREILVVDGGSTDGTQTLVQEAARRDGRIRLLDASPVPPDWNGKAWGLQVGWQAASAESSWLLTMDADVRPRAGLVSALVARAEADGVATVSVATLQETTGWALGLLHPACLTTLVYRLGRPGRLARRPQEVQANGQCQLFARAPLARVGGFGGVRASRCEDMTIARALVANGGLAGFYETASSDTNAGAGGAAPSPDDRGGGGLVTARMYENWREAWDGWTRSLPLRDRYTRWSSVLGLVEVTAAQGLPLPSTVALAAVAFGRPRQRDRATLALLALNVLLFLVRLGVLAGVRRAYVDPPWTYWLSPLADFPVIARLWRSMLTTRHTWRGRSLVTGVHS